MSSDPLVSERKPRWTLVRTRKPGHGPSDDRIEGHVVSDGTWALEDNECPSPHLIGAGRKVLQGLRPQDVLELGLQCAWLIDIWSRQDDLDDIEQPPQLIDDLKRLAALRGKALADVWAETEDLRKALTRLGKRIGKLPLEWDRFCACSTLVYHGSARAMAKRDPAKDEPVPISGTAEDVDDPAPPTVRSDREPTLAGQGVSAVIAVEADKGGMAKAMATTIQMLLSAVGDLTADEVAGLVKTQTFGALVQGAKDRRKQGGPGQNVRLVRFVEHWGFLVADGKGGKYVAYRCVDCGLIGHVYSQKRPRRKAEEPVRGEQQPLALDMGTTP